MLKGIMIKASWRKIIRAAFPVVLAMLVFAGCLLLSRGVSPGTTDQVQIDLGSSTRFSLEERQAAADAVLRFFPQFENCDLKKLWYDEEILNQEIESHPDTYGADMGNTMLLMSTFTVNSEGGNGLSPNTTYTDWKFILKNRAFLGWAVDSYGLY